MERYIYYSIIIFSIIIEFLYVYIILEKILESIKTKLRTKYEKQYIHIIDSIINEVIDKGYTDKINEKKLKCMLKSKLKREIVEERIGYFLEFFRGDFTELLIKFCEDFGIVDYAIKNLKTNNIHSMALSCKRVGKIRSKKAIPYLLKKVRSNVQDVKYNALLALAKIGDEQSFINGFSKISGSILLSERSLIEIIDSFEGDKSIIYSKMMDSEDEFLSSLFIKSAGNYLDYSFSEKIAGYLSDSSKEIRIAAIKALSNIKDKKYIDKIYELFEDESWEIRALAAKALGGYRDVDIVPHLIPMLSDLQWFVRYNSAVAILKLDKELKYVAKVMKGNDRFAKDILISAMEELDLLSKIVFEKSSEENYDSDLAKLIKDYIDKGGEPKDE